MATTSVIFEAVRRKTRELHSFYDDSIGHTKRAAIDASATAASDLAILSLRDLNRLFFKSVQDCQKVVAAERNRIDATNLTYQNLVYETAQIRHQIDLTRAFPSSYADLVREIDETLLPTEEREGVDERHEKLMGILNAEQKSREDDKDHIVRLKKRKTEIEEEIVKKRSIIQGLKGKVLTLKKSLQKAHFTLPDNTLGPSKERLSGVLSQLPRKLYNLYFHGQSFYEALGRSSRMADVKAATALSHVSSTGKAVTDLGNLSLHPCAITIEASRGLFERASSKEGMSEQRLKLHFEYSQALDKLFVRVFVILKAGASPRDVTSSMRLLMADNDATTTSTYEFTESPERSAKEGYMNVDGDSFGNEFGPVKGTGYFFRWTEVLGKEMQPNHPEESVSRLLTVFERVFHRLLMKDALGEQISKLNSKGLLQVKRSITLPVPSPSAHLLAWNALVGSTSDEANSEKFSCSFGGADGRAAEVNVVVDVPTGYPRVAPTFHLSLSSVAQKREVADTRLLHEAARKAQLLRLDGQTKNSGPTFNQQRANPPAIKEIERILNGAFKVEGSDEIFTTQPSEKEKGRGKDIQRSLDAVEPPQEVTLLVPVGQEGYVLTYRIRQLMHLLDVYLENKKAVGVLRRRRGRDRLPPTIYHPHLNLFLHE